MSLKNKLYINVTKYNILLKISLKNSYCSSKKIWKKEIRD